MMLSKHIFYHLVDIRLIRLTGDRFVHWTFIMSNGQKKSAIGCNLTEKLCIYLFLVFLLFINNLGQTAKKKFIYLSWILTHKVCAQNEFTGNTQNFCVENAKLAWSPVCEHDVPCDLEKTIMEEVIEHVESCSSITKNTPPSQFFW